ncbi:methyltransferase [Legionella maioricensis]|uniref:Methyltransferase n=1 Tax=Legionella maioricensis TaxID=2896528 RepID=A0A9X2D3I9_9GAMM|nr:methyltransferase [Legionella maioricensis]MCL9685592.1 methyltransferase [Legionella maioricensis]MCL9689001.1 methyltransferase [Legionella maioricensis]
MNKESVQPHVQLAVMSREYVVSRAIHTIANLGIADHMSEQPISVQELARLTSTVPDLLDRLLNFLTVYGLFSKNGDAYALTPLSAPLRGDHPYSMKDVLSMVDESWWQAFAQLETALKTGTTAFKLQHGTDFFDFLNHNPEKKTRFRKGIEKLSSFDDNAITQGYNFGQFKHVVDIGAGLNNLSKVIAIQYPSTTTILFNLMEKINQQVTNDYFSSLPTADAYLFKGVLHDFGDEQVKNILTNCYKHLPKHASLIIAEQAMPQNEQPHTNKTMDIIMMVLVGGKQRTLNNWCELIEAAGFKLKNTYATPGVYTIMEFSV